MRSFAFILLVFAALMAPFPFFLFCAFLYIFLWTGFELLVVTAFIDMLFGMTSTSFLYTLSVGTLLLCAEVLRPYLSRYATRV